MKTSHKIALQYGILMGVVAVTGFILQQLVSAESVSYKIISLSTSAIEALTIYLGVKKYMQEKPQAKFFDFLVLSLFTGLVAGIIVWAYMALYYTVIVPEAMEPILEKQREVLEKETGYSPEQIQKSINSFKDYFLYFLFAGAIIGQLFIALLAGTVTAVLANPRRTSQA